MEMIEVPQNADDKYWIDCRVNSLNQFLLYYGINISRHYIFLLSEAYTFYYFYINFKEAKVSHIPFAAASESCLEEKLFQALKISSVSERLDDSEEAFEKLRNLTQSGIPVLMHTIEQMFIRHVEVLEKLKVNIRMQSIPILIKIDEMDNYVLYWISAGQKNPIMIRNKEEIDRLRSIDCAPYPPDYNCTYVSGKVSGISKEFLNEKLHQAIKNIAQKMLFGNYLDPVAKKNLNATDVYVGLEAIGKMNSELKTMMLYMSENPNDKNYLNRCYLSILIVKIGLFKGSKSSFRKEFGDTLCQFASEISDERLSKIGIKFIEISLDWKRLFRLISQMTRKNLSIELFSKICDTFESIYKSEYNEFYELAKYYGI